MGNALHDKTIVVVGRGSGIARAVALRAHDEGARVIVAGRGKGKLAGADGGPAVTPQTVDAPHDTPISTPPQQGGAPAPVVSTAAAPGPGEPAAPQRQKLHM